MLLLMRTVGAMYATIADCDEGMSVWGFELMAVFNFYEPLHYFQHGSGFQTWELSPEFGIRSWAYVLLHLPMANLLPRLLRFTKVSFSHYLVASATRRDAVYLTSSVENSSRCACASPLSLPSAKPASTERSSKL